MIPWDAVGVVFIVVGLAAWPMVMFCDWVRGRVGWWRAQVGAWFEARRVVRRVDLAAELIFLCAGFGCSHPPADVDLMRLADEVDDGRGDLARWWQP